jgi:hypothetical protein
MESLKRSWFRGGSKMNRWYCMDCKAEVELDNHGRCGCCESEAVDSMEPRGGLTAVISVAQAESTYSVATS